MAEVSPWPIQHALKPASRFRAEWDDTIVKDLRMGANSGHVPLRKAGISSRLRVPSCEDWDVYTWKEVNLGEIFNGDVNSAAELFAEGPSRDLFRALIAAEAYGSSGASIDCLEEHIERQHGPGADEKWQGVSRLLKKLSRGAKGHGYKLFEEDAQTGSWRIAAQWAASVSASKQDSLRDAAIEALAPSSYYCQVRCTLLPPRVPRLSLMLSSLHKEGQVCSLRLALDPEIED